MFDDASEINAKYYSFNRLVYYHHLRSSLSLKKNRARLRFNRNVSKVIAPVWSKNLNRTKT